MPETMHRAVFDALLTRWFLKNMLPLSPQIQQMAAKSSKKPSQKIPAKKVPKKTPQKKEKIVPKLPIVPTSEVEVVVAGPNLISPEVLELIAGVEKEVGAITSMTDEEVQICIETCAMQAVSHSKRAKSSISMSLVFAWGCGAMLNAVKADLRHGEFDKWRKEHFVDLGYSERSSRRYMNLAAAYPDVRDLLAWSPGLTKSYIACGILPDTSPTDRPGEKEKPHPTAALYTGVRKFHESLDLFTKTLDAFRKSKEELSPEDKRQLILMKNELSEFLQRIIGQLP